MPQRLNSQHDIGLQVKLLVNSINCNEERALLTLQNSCEFELKRGENSLLGTRALLSVSMNYTDLLSHDG